MLQSFQFLLAIRYYARNEFLVSNASFWSSLAVIKGVMLLLVAGNLAQIVIWGLLFVPVGELKDFGDAFYHSAVSFATLGCGAIVVSSEQGVLGPLKAVNGVLRIGVSTAGLTAAFQDTMRKTIAARSQ